MYWLYVDSCLRTGLDIIISIKQENHSDYYIELIGWLSVGSIQD